MAEIAAIKKFGESHGIKPTSNYKEYVKLDRSAAVYVVSAAEELQFKSKEWKFPIVGSFPYLGWFDLGNAKDYAADLRKEGWDVDVRGAAAYSTLGWFRDAVLSTMIPPGDEALGELVNVVLHESIHATIYVNGQAYFNESIASFVADRLTPEYLKDRKEVYASYVKAEEEGERRRKQLHDAYLKLAAIYASSQPDNQKREEKRKLLDALKAELGFKREINNATLIQFKTYATDGNDFEALWKACGSDSARFLKSALTLKPSSFGRPQQENLREVLLPLVKAGCPG